MKKPRQKLNDPIKDFSKDLFFIRIRQKGEKTWMYYVSRSKGNVFKLVSSPVNCKEFRSESAAEAEVEALLENYPASIVQVGCYTKVEMLINTTYA